MAFRSVQKKATGGVRGAGHDSDGHHDNNRHGAAEDNASALAKA